MIEDEYAETDRVKFEIYLYYAKAIGLGLSVASVVLYACFQVLHLLLREYMSLGVEVGLVLNSLHAPKQNEKRDTPLPNNLAKQFFWAPTANILAKFTIKRLYVCSNFI